MATTFRDRVFLALFICLFSAVAMFGQSASTGAIAGTVTDPTGAIVANATVSVTSLATGQVRTLQTSGDGLYKATLLPPGHYQVKVEAPGFAAADIPDVNVLVTETPVVNVKLAVGSTAQSVEVQGAADVVQTDNATLGATVAGKTMTELPLSTRNFTQLLGLSAGANADVSNATALGKGTQQIQVNGGSYLNNTYSMDGSVVNNFTSNGTTEQGTNAAFGIPNPDAIQEFKIQTSNYDASYGRNSGANVNVVTKSGTNHFHGTVFEFFRNTALNANDFFNKYTQLSQGQPNKQQVYNQNQFGGSFGGPAIKDKLFFFASYQQTNQKNGATGYGYSQGVNLPTLPSGDRSTAAWRQQLGAIYCHQPTYTQIIGLGGVQVACDGSNINPVALNVLNLKLPNGSYYVPGAPAGGGPVSYSVPAIYHEYQGIGNFDYLVNSKNTVSGRYFVATDPTNAPFPGSGLGFPAPNVPGNPVFFQYGNQSASLKWTSTITPNFLNEARLSYQRTTVVNNNEIPFTDSQIGMQPVQASIPGMSNIWFLPIFGSTSMDLGSHPFYTQNEAINQYTLADSISWSHGKHTIRAGFDIEKDQWNWIMPSLSTGAVIFGSFPDFLVGLSGCAPGTFPFQCNTGNPGNTNGTPISNILSIPNFVARQAGAGVYHGYRSSAYDFFVQDDIRLNPRLTINAGLRWDYYPALWDNTGQMTNLVPGLIAAAGIPGSTPATGSFAGYEVGSNYQGPPIPSGVFQNSNKTVVGAQPKTNFAPRLGFSWQPIAGYDKFVVRGGGGFFYDRVPGSSFIWATQQNIPYAFSIPYGSSVSLAQPFDQTPVGWNAPRWVDFTNESSSNLAQNLLINNLTTPLVYTWNLNWQWEFAQNWVLEAGYVGTRGIHGLNFNVDYINYAPLASPANPIHGVTDNTSGNAVLRVPYLGVAANDTATTNRGDSHYNAMQVTIKKSLSYGLNLQANYTWSRTSSTSGSDNDHPEVIDFQTGKLIYQEVYRPQIFNVMYSYNFPLQDGPGFKAKAFGGWNLSGATVIQSGSPLSINYAQGGTVYFGTTSALAHPNYCAGKGPGDVGAGGSLTNRVISGLNGGPGYYNSGVFCGVPSYGPGTSGSGYGGISVIRGPGQNNWNMALQKTTRVGGINEGASLLFRTEFFNVFNHTMFKDPNSDSSSPTYGQITGTAVNPRIIQFALKYVF